MTDAPDAHPETRICHFVFPGDTNHLGTLYGGTLMAWMDSAAAIAGVRRAGTRTVVTAVVDELTFRVAIREGELVELIAEVESVRGVGPWLMEGHAADILDMVAAAQEVAR